MTKETDLPVQESDDTLFNSQFQRIFLFFAIAFIGFGYILSTLAEIASPLDGRTCITGPWKLALILTHVLAFVLIPLAMKVFYQALTALQKPKSAIFASQLGLSFIMVSIASEIGWHVTQCWYYPPGSPFGFARCSTWGDPKTALDSPVAQLGETPRPHWLTIPFLF